MSPKNGADKEFLSEAEELIETLGRELLRYEEAIGGPGRVDPDILNGIFRAAHSLKGLAGMFGFVELSEMSHSMENLLDRMRLGKVQTDPEIMDVLFSGVEGLKALLGDDGDKDRAKEIIERIEEAAEGMASANRKPETAALEKPASSRPDEEIVVFEGVEFPRAVIDVLTEYEEFRLQENIRSETSIVKVHAGFDLTDFDTELPNLMEWLKEQGEVITTLPGGGEGGADDQIHFDLLVGLDSSVDNLKAELESRGFALSVIRAKEGKSAKKAAVENKPAKAGDGEGGEAEEEDECADRDTHDNNMDAESARSVSRTVRVDISRLDLLMNIVGELVLEKSIIGNIRDQISQEAGLRMLSNDLYKAHRTLDRKLAELQEAVMDVRMVPIGHLFGRLGRIVRKIGREQKKEIDLIRTGMETELDKLIIEELADPLMHIIRNSIDHGIESPDVRRELGKPEKGRIELHAYQLGNHVVIEVFDDGAGIDVQKVRRKAESMGLISSKVELSREEYFNFLFEPGFSTKEEVSELSGRGVGLDVVKRNINNLSGLIEIDSEPGEGTCFTITLPITLAIIQALIVECSGRTYALPLNSVRECHIIHSDDITTIEQREVMELREQTIPLLRLANLFGYDSGSCYTTEPDNGAAAGQNPETEKDRTAVKKLAVEKVPEELMFAVDEEDEEEKEFVVILGIADRRMGVLVDRMVGRQDVVIKSLGKTLGNIPGVAGATDLGNQQTVLVLDVGDLLEEIGHLTSERSSSQGRWF